MGIGRTNAGGGGGAGLNFSVKAYASVDELPSVEKENTIAVITENEIPNWILCTTEPENPEPGSLWFEIGTESDVSFNALKKNAIQIKLVKANQYIDGEFSSIDGYIYMNGWKLFSEVQTFLYLYKEGDECTAVTGGWNGTKGSNYISYGGSNSGGTNLTKGKFNCSGFTQMVIEFAVTDTHGSSNGDFTFTLKDSSVSIKKATKYYTLNERATITLDVSGVTTDVYFHMAYWYASVSIYNVYLMP